MLRKVQRQRDPIADGAIQKQSFRRILDRFRCDAVETQPSKALATQSVRLPGVAAVVQIAFVPFPRCGRRACGAPASCRRVGSNWNGPNAGGSNAVVANARGRLGIRLPKVGAPAPPRGSRAERSVRVSCLHRLTRCDSICAPTPGRHRRHSRPAFGKRPVGGLERGGVA